jgi:hypothetical protein
MDHPSGNGTRYDSKSHACGVDPLGDTSVKFVRTNTIPDIV